VAETACLKGRLFYMRRQEVIAELKYIADSPAKKYGGFHENAVGAAKAALKIIDSPAKSTKMTKSEIIPVLKSLDYHDRIDILREFCRMGGCEK
jgi:hypothetical protein